ncbi:DUF4833 domain-containing protein [Sphingobacterium sp. HJSM2_6]|uniref:DUF4833 domain-containing protein n=1 Tax=Sphingobacterium sp. HJSM2_6 TaxID=3366264 RepID=UPI003BD002C0
MVRYYLLFLLLFYVKGIYAQDHHPSPTNKENLLFYIQHNQGKNTFIYRLNIQKNNQLDLKEPIVVSRQLFDKDASVRPITKLQQNFAYGIETDQINAHVFEAKIVSLPSQKMRLIIPVQGKPYVETTVNNQTIQLNRIFLNIKQGTSGLNTKVEYILFYGISKNKETVIKLIL